LPSCDSKSTVPRPLRKTEHCRNKSGAKICFSFHFQLLTGYDAVWFCSGTEHGILNEVGGALPKPWLNTQKNALCQTELIMDAAITGAEIRYTLHGSAPTALSPKYEKPFSIITIATMKAVSQRKGMAISPISELVVTVVGTSITHRHQFSKGHALKSVSAFGFTYSLHGNEAIFSLPYTESDWQVRMFDMQGHALVMNSNKKGDWRLPLSDLSKGHYLISLQTKVQIQSARWVWLGE